MAIQNRRGNYTDFAGGANLQDGEFGIVMSGDTNTTDGTGTYISNGGGIVHRLATDDDISSLDTEIANLNSGYTENLSLQVISVPSGTWTDVYTYSFPKGKYLVICGVAFDTDANGFRACDFAPSSAGSTHGRLSPMLPATTSQTRMQVVRLVNFSATTSYSVWAYQNSGSALNVYPSIAFIKLV